MDQKKIKVLLCPLDWGLGHATRCVPVIRLLTKYNFDIILAADGPAYNFFRVSFPDFSLIRFPGARITYPAGRGMGWKMLAQSPGIIFHILLEHLRLKKLIREQGASIVISDNRFGLWSKRAYCIYLTHQVMIKAPHSLKWLEPLLHRLHRWFMKRYDEIWIPDLPGNPNLSGDLGHLYRAPGKAGFAGLLSRFEPPAVPVRRPVAGAPDLLVLLSGPEPQRSLFEDLVLSELRLHKGLHAVIVQGRPGADAPRQFQPGVTIFSHLPDALLKDLILTATRIICRPGYSTLMDLAALGRTAILVPTPGQTEQEYLSRNLSQSGRFTEILQQDFNLDYVLKAGGNADHWHSMINDPQLAEKLVAGLRNNLDRAGKNL